MLGLAGKIRPRSLGARYVGGKPRPLRTRRPVRSCVRGLARSGEKLAPARPLDLISARRIAPGEQPSKACTLLMHFAVISAVRRRGSCPSLPLRTPRPRAMAPPCLLAAGGLRRGCSSRADVGCRAEIGGQISRHQHLADLIVEAAGGELISFLVGAALPLLLLEQHSAVFQDSRRSAGAGTRSSARPDEADRRASSRFQSLAATKRPGSGDELRRRGRGRLGR